MNDGRVGYGAHKFYSKVTPFSHGTLFVWYISLHVPAYLKRKLVPDGGGEVANETKKSR